MKPYNNNLSVVMAYAIPTAVAFLGLLWLLRRKKDGDDDSTSAEADSTSAKDTSHSAPGKNSRDVTAPSTVAIRHQLLDRKLDAKEAVEMVRTGSGDGPVRKADFSILERQSKDAEKTQDSEPEDGKGIAADAEVTASSVSTSDTQVNNSCLLQSAAPDKENLTAAGTVHTSGDASALPAEKDGNQSVSATDVDSVLKKDPTVLKKDPVQLLVRQSEEKLKEDDAAIVQAKLSHSTLQSCKQDSSKPVFGHSSTDSSGYSVQSDLSRSSQEPAAVKEVVEVFSQASHALSQQSVPVSSALPSKSERPESPDRQLRKPTEEKESRKDPLQGSNSRIGAKSLDSNSESAKNVAFNLGTLPDKDSLNADDSCNTNGSSLAPLPSTLSSESEVLEMRSQTITVLQTSESISQMTESGSESKTVTVLTKDKPHTKNEAAKDSKGSTGRVAANGVAANSHPTSTGTAATKDVKSGGETPESKNVKPATEDTGEIRGAKSEKEQVNTSSSVITSPPASSAKVLPNKQTHSSPPPSTAPEKTAASQSKVLHQQKSKSSPSPPSNSFSSKRRVKSGSSDRTSDSTVDGDGVTVGQTSSEVAENGRVPDSGSPICDTNSEASNDSGRGGSVGDTLVHLSAGEVVRFEFNFPSELCGRLIGRGGKNIQHIKEQSGATVTLSSNPFTPEFQVCRVQGLQAEVDRALMMIRKKFPQAQHPLLDMSSLTPPPPTSVVLPEIMQLNLPEGVSIDIVVSAIVNAGHIFIQQPTHPTFPSLERLSHFMNACYGDQNVPMLPRPVEGGIICAAESEGQWYRAQVVQVYPHQDECDIKYVDYGGYTRVPINSLKQIRSDFMTLPFQAVECFLANITPLQDEEYFSDKASEVLMELTSGKMLQGQVIGRGDDSFCYVHLYQVSGHSVLLINREMVNREVVRWIEIL